MAGEWQVETVYAESLEATTAPARVETLYAEALATGSAPAQTEAVYAEALVFLPLSALVEALYAEALIAPSALVPPVTSNIYDTVKQREAYLLTGTGLVPHSFRL